MSLCGSLQTTSRQSNNDKHAMKSLASDLESLITIMDAEEIRSSNIRTPYLIDMEAPISKEVDINMMSDNCEEITDC